MSAEKGLEAFAKSSTALSEANIAQLAAATQLMRSHSHILADLRMKQDLDANFNILVPFLEKYLKVGEPTSISSYDSDTDINSSDFDSDAADDVDILSTSSKIIQKSANKQVKENARNFNNFLENCVYFLWLGRN